MSAPFFIEAPHPTRLRLVACVDEAATYVSAQVCEFKFSATLAPFKSEADARAALEAAGANMGEAICTGPAKRQGGGK
ncbi:MAG TPA: hypothetical protein VEZ70_14360 [Allosphingosinicella sp.]|nr:hypothetical protein [Allosphingosinicella sp.]